MKPRDYTRLARNTLQKQICAKRKHFSLVKLFLLKKSFLWKSVQSCGYKKGLKKHITSIAEMERTDKIKYIEHPSDVGFEVYGDTPKELFANAAVATYSFMTDIDEIAEDEERDIELKSEDIYSLMFDWIDELLFLFESELLILKKFDIEVSLSEFSLKGKCTGGKFDPSEHVSGIIVKAVTYNMMEIKKNEVWHARVVLDV